MKKLHIVAILLALFAIQKNYAQEEENGSNQVLLSNLPPSALYSFDNSDKTIRGSVYIQNAFMPAKLSLEDGTKIFKLRYNAFNDEIEIEIDGQEPNALNRNIDNLLIIFVGDDKTYEAVDYINDEGSTVRGYFVHANDAHSKHQLLIKESIKFVDRKPAKTSYDKGKPAEFIRLDDRYFIAIGDNPAVEFPKKKKDLSNIFPDKYDDIIDFMKENKIKTSREEDLIELVNYINLL
ncbi:hypothetical protein [Psychroserpens mesophilus]|uniref:hypothetical protein n=1 Tax=Psychroserpens mesophilus TaxID=325473 RepID=UPI003D657912